MIVSCLPSWADLCRRSIEGAVSCRRFDEIKLAHAGQCFLLLRAGDDLLLDLRHEASVIPWAQSRSLTLSPQLLGYFG